MGGLISIADCVYSKISYNLRKFVGKIDVALLMDMKREKLNGNVIMNVKIQYENPEN